MSFVRYLQKCIVGTVVALAAVPVFAVDPRPSTQVQITGGDELLKADVVSSVGANRLSVDGVFTESIIPTGTAVYFLQALLNGATENMNANGTLGTPVNFTYTPGASETFYMEALNVFFWDNGVTNPTNFGALATLTNGVNIQVRSKGVLYDMAVLKTNIDFINVFSRERIAVGTSGFLENSDIYFGVLHFDHPVILQNSTGDFVRVQIRDNLSGLDQFRIRAKIWKGI